VFDDQQTDKSSGPLRAPGGVRPLWFHVGGPGAGGSVRSLV